jgi:hypothetical protein
MTAAFRQYPHADATSTPFLLWNDTIASRDGAALACPQCGGANLHLDAVHFAVPTHGHYTPTVGLSIQADTGLLAADDQGQRLHAGQNRGPMLAISYWCEAGCLGSVRLRQHKGVLYTSLHTEAPPPDNSPSDEPTEDPHADEPPF